MVCIADQEKTLIDCIDKQQYAGGISEVAKGLWEAKKEIDFEKLIEYAIKMENKSLLKRLGYLLDLLNLYKNNIEIGRSLKIYKKMNY